MLETTIQQVCIVINRLIPRPNIVGGPDNTLKLILETIIFIVSHKYNIFTCILSSIFSLAALISITMSFFMFLTWNVGIFGFRILKKYLNLRKIDLKCVFLALH